MAGSREISADATIRVPFDEALSMDSLPGNVTLDGAPPAGMGLQDGGRTLVIQRDDFAPGQKVVVEVGADLSDRAGNRLGRSFAFHFWVDGDGLRLLEQRPADGTRISPDTPSLRFTFDEPVDPYSLRYSRLSAQ